MFDEEIIPAAYTYIFCKHELSLQKYFVGTDTLQDAFSFLYIYGSRESEAASGTIMGGVYFHLTCR